MAETIGTITEIKVGTVAAAALDFGTLRLKENSTGHTWLFYLWSWTAEDEPAVHRVLHTQRLALAREAAFRKLTVHIFHGQIESSIVDSIQVDIP